MGLILLKDIIHFEESKCVKIKFNQTSKDGKIPLHEWLINHNEVDTNWLFWKSKKNPFQKDWIAICFVEMNRDIWLLTTIKKITKVIDIKEDEGVGFDGEIYEIFEKYFGRLIVKYHKPRAQCIFYDKIMDNLEVLQILPSIYDGEEFRGYDNVYLSYNQLKVIVDRRKSDWINALTNQKAVYLITDKKTGKLYVGSATSKNGMLLARWQSYINTFDGGNVEFKKLMKEHGENYIKQNFHYSILENFNSKIDDKYILQRENWWKEVLNSRIHGYNNN